MGLSPEHFNAFTVGEFIYCWTGWMELQRSKSREAWEIERWSAWVLTCIQLDKKDRHPMTEMFPLPWDEPTQPKVSPQMTMEERRERVKQMLNKQS